MIEVLKVLKGIQDKEKKVNVTKVRNELLEALVHKNNIIALKIIMYISKANIILEPNRLHTLKLDINKCLEYCKIDKRTFKNNLRQLQETSITFLSTKDKNKVEEYITLIPRIEFIENRKYVEIDIYDKIYKLICDVKNKFTILDVENFSKIDNKNTARVLMLLERINNYEEHIPKMKTCTLEELNKMFDTNYKTINDFKKGVIEPAQKELKEKSKLSFEFDVNFDIYSKTKGRPKAKNITIYLTKPKEIII